jgi:hypothetical protein
MTKRRTVYSEPLAELANVYFRLAGIPIRFSGRKPKTGGSGK